MFTFFFDSSSLFICCFDSVLTVGGREERDDWWTERWNKQSAPSFRRRSEFSESWKALKRSVHRCSNQRLFLCACFQVYAAAESSRSCGGEINSCKHLTTTWCWLYGALRVRLMKVSSASHTSCICPPSSMKTSTFTPGFRRWSTRQGWNYSTGLLVFLFFFWKADFSFTLTHLLKCNRVYTSVSYNTLNFNLKATLKNL